MGKVKLTVNEELSIEKVEWCRTLLCKFTEINANQLAHGIGGTGIFITSLKRSENKGRMIRRKCLKFIYVINYGGNTKTQRMEHEI